VYSVKVNDVSIKLETYIKEKTKHTEVDRSGVRSRNLVVSGTVFRGRPTGRLGRSVKIDMDILNVQNNYSTYHWSELF